MHFVRLDTISVSVEIALSITYLSGCVLFRFVFTCRRCHLQLVSTVNDAMNIIYCMHSVRYLMCLITILMKLLYKLFYSINELVS